MTRDELQEKRRTIVQEHTDGFMVTEILEELDALDAEYAASQRSAEDRFYAMIREHDIAYRLLLQSQGNAAAIRGAIDGMIRGLVKFAEDLK